MPQRVTRTAILIAAATLAAGVAWIDSIADYNFSVAILYLLVLVLVSAVGTAATISRAGWLCIALTVVVWALVHLPDPDLGSALRCVFACIAIRVTAALLVSKKRLESLKRDLEGSRSEVELFANSVPFVLWHSNPQGEIVYLNESWTKVTGLDRWSVLAGQKYNEVVHPDDIPALNETVGHAVATRTMTDLKVRIRQADGSYRWMQIYDSPVLSPLSGEVERYGGLSDVHNEILAKEELEKVRSELEASRAELINFTDSVPQILWRADVDAKVDFHNRRYTEVTGRTLAETLELQDYIADFHPDDREAFQELLHSALSARTELRATYRLRHADGSYRWMSLVGRPVRIAEGSDEVRYYGGVSDIHDEVLAHQKVRELNETLEQRVSERTAELMRTERRYSALFDVSNMTFAEMDFSAAERILDAVKAKGVVDLRAYMAAHPDELARTLGAVRTTRVNEALARLMGYDSAAELIANPPAANAEDGAEVLMRQLEMYYHGVDHIDGRTVLAGRHGRRIPVYFAVTRLPDGVYLSSHVDLSEQERIAGLHQAAQAELARANRVATVGAFSASIAHELNQPIASMLVDAKTGLRFIGREDLDRDALDRILQRMEKTAQRIARIVERTRESIVAGRRPVTGIDLRKLVFETHDLLEPDLKRSGIEIEILCSDRLPSIDGDPVELQQVLVNLVNNAADAVRDQPGPRRITISVETRDASVHVEVTDTGPGVPPDALARLFEPFFTTKAGGIGMGLQICRTAVEAMGGELLVDNVPGQGARFSFDLPSAPAAASQGA